MSKRLYLFIKEFDKERQSYIDVEQDARQEVDNLENEFYYVIKEYFNKLAEEMEEEKSYNLLLQKQITMLKKEKVDLSIMINNLNSKVDCIEKDLGISLQTKRQKKKWN